MKSILVIDETGAVADTVRQLPESLEVDVDYVPDALNGLILAKDRKPVAIVTSLQQAWVGSLPITEVVERDRNFHGVRVIVVTDDGNELSAPHGRSLGTRPLHLPSGQAELAQQLEDATRVADSLAPDEVSRTQAPSSGA